MQKLDISNDISVHRFSWPIGIQLFLRQLLALADIGSIVFEFYILKILPKHVCKGGKTVLFICVLMSDSAFFRIVWLSMSALTA